MTSSKVKRGSKLFPTDPVAAAGGALSAWFQLARGTVTGAGYSSVPDSLDASSPAVQSTDARRPENQLSNNGLPVMSFGANHVLGSPLTTARNGATFWGLGAWVRPTTINSFKLIVAIANTTGGASANKILPHVALDTFRLGVYVSGSAGRNATTPSTSVAANTWYFVTFEYDANGATEALRNVITINGVPQTLSFVDFGAGGTTGALQTPTGNLLIGNQQDTTSALNPFTGLMGPNLYMFGSKMTAAATGLLTQQARLALMNYQRPT